MSKDEKDTAEAPKKSKKMLLMIIVVAVVALLGGGAGAFFMLRGDSAEAAPPEKGAVKAIDTQLTINLADGHYLKMGFALQQTDMSSETPEDFAAEARRQMVDYESALAGLPNLVRVVGGHVAKVGYDYDAEFLFGLDVILDGLERLLDRR